MARVGCAAPLRHAKAQGFARARVFELSGLAKTHQTIMSSAACITGLCQLGKTASKPMALVALERIQSAREPQRQQKEAQERRFAPATAAACLALICGGPTCQQKCSNHEF